MQALFFSWLCDQWTEAAAERPLSLIVTLVALLLVAGCKRQLLGAQGDDLPMKAAKPPGGPTSLCGKDRLVLPVASGASTAAECWAGEFGRFKYANSRPDPFDNSLGFPAYSMQPPDLAYPELSSQEASALDELTKRVSDMPPRHRKDPNTLARFLRARKFSVDSAENYFRSAAAWRDERGAHEVLTRWDLKPYESLMPWWPSGGALGLGRQGELVVWDRLPRCSIPQLVRSLGWEALEKIEMVHLLRSLGAIEEDALRRQIPTRRILIVVDCGEFCWENASFAAARTMRKIVHIRDQFSPEIAKVALLVRAPKAYLWVWNSFKYMLDENTRGKFHVASSETQSLALLREYLTDDNIPAYLGGKKHIEGDPECRKVIAPGGPLPEEAISRFWQLLAEPASSDLSEQPRCDKGEPGRKGAASHSQALSCNSKRLECFQGWERLVGW